MKPNDHDDRRMGTPLIPQRSYVHTPPPTQRQANTQAAAANIVRDQLNSIYAGNTTTPTPQTTPVQQTEPTATPQQPAVAAQPATTIESQDQPELADTNPYQRTQANPASIQADQWKQYHSAWQDYYQKYYERYYVGQVQRTSHMLEERAAAVARQAPAATSTLSTAIANAETEQPGRDEPMSRDEAMLDLRNKLLGQIQTSAVKVRKSRHFFPIAAAVCVVLLFLFLQYNRVLIANVQAYIAPGNVDPASIMIDPTTTVAVSDEPKLIIPKINVDVPVDYNATPDNASQMDAMNRGVAYFGIPGANSKPGQIGNVPIAGHSSNDVIDSGNYKFIFARLDALVEGDTIYLNYEGTRYVYTITKKEVVKPNEVNKLIYPTDKPVITLITCTPLGTALNRLLVTAEQVSPSPAKAEAAPEQPAADAPAAAMPGNSPTFLQRIFGGGN